MREILPSGSEGGAKPHPYLYQRHLNGLRQDATATWLCMLEGAVPHAHPSASSTARITPMMLSPAMQPEAMGMV